ncbi:MAG TPA: 3-hydroxyacyl-CoA dehydrogenase NAD-binding domain-containing protein [Burkholderiaceae bacterium]|nr:3-hydroxyacyl-CoA dehydrogenase NAD-binding domain-containing protein [Burkholderiaceae bacterium]
MSADYTIRDGVAVITLNNPPVNGLGLATRLAFAAGVDKALLDPDIVAIVVTGAGRVFSGGADIREFGSPKSTQEPNLLTLIRLVESATKPVVAAINATAMGGGLELAMGCHYRVAARHADVGLPEVKIGLIPGAGGTQRLPRLAGLEAAVNMIVSGEPLKADALASTRLFDRVVDGDVVAAAVEFARDAARRPGPHPRARDLKVEHDQAQAFLKFSRNTVAAIAKNYPAPVKCVDAVTASVTMPFDEAMRAEREAFIGLMFTPESRALRHAFLGERAASKIADVPESTPVREIRRAAVIGAGTMGGGIAMNFANAGIPVTVVETTGEALERGLGTVRRNYENSARKGKLTEEALAKRMSLIQGTLSYDDIRDADIVVEAVFEDIGVKEKVFRQLDATMKPGAILASNTSTLDVDRIASFTKRPGDVIGLHFFSPANVMKLLEVVRGAATSKDVLATAMKLAKTIRKTAVVSGVCDGFIGNRMIEQYSRQAGFLLEEGCLPAQVDRAIEKFGFAMGPFRMGDLAGNDIGWAIRKRRYVEKPDVTYSKTADLLCEMGRFGQKTGAGWYDYAPGDRTPKPSKVVDDMVVAHSKALRIERRRIGDDEIVERLVYALVNEGARILEEGIASKASDIDMVYLTGYGFPPWRGGPMCYADTVGLFNVVAAMRRFAGAPHAERQAGAWVPAPLLERLASEGKSFTA